MTNNEFTTEQTNNLKAILHKGASVWFERNKVETKRVTEYISINQGKLGVDISLNFVILPDIKE